MKKAGIFTLSVLMVMALMSASAHCQDDMESVDNSAFDNPRRSSAIFFHDAHNEKAGIDDCAQCHHLYDEQGQKLVDESSEDQSCADCHLLEDTGRRPGLMKAYHLNCKGCHLAQQKGPIVCAECHLKK